VTGAAPSSFVNLTVNSTTAPAAPSAVGGAVTAGLGGRGWAPLIGVAHSLLTSTCSHPPPVLVAG
jgi:hypothetical protein